MSLTDRTRGVCVRTAAHVRKCRHGASCSYMRARAPCHCPAGRVHVAMRHTIDASACRKQMQHAHVFTCHRSARSAAAGMPVAPCTGTQRNYTRPYVAWHPSNSAWPVRGRADTSITRGTSARSVTMRACARPCARLVELRMAARSAAAGMPVARDVHVNVITQGSTNFACPARGRTGAKSSRANVCVPRNQLALVMDISIAYCQRPVRSAVARTPVTCIRRRKIG